MFNKISNIFKKHKIVTRIIALLLAINMSLSTFMVAFADETSDDNSISGMSGSTTYTGANSRVQAFLDLAAGKQADSFGDIKFTKDQLQFLGVFVSNYYIPFGTELGAAAGEETNDTIEAVKKSLMHGLSFEESYAEMFTDEIMGLARASAKSNELSLAVSSKYGEGFKEVKVVNGNYYNFLATMIGGAGQLFSHYDGDTFSNANYGYWGYNDGGSFKPVADFVISGNDMTAFQSAFMTCLRNVPYSEGYGYNLFDMSKKELDVGGANKLSKEDSLKVSILGSRMMVDCFGDIIIYGEEHQVIAVPGAVNPYTWQAVDASGNDILYPGEAYNMINIPSMAAADDGSLFTSIGVSDNNSNVGPGGNGSTSGNGNETIITKNIFGKTGSFQNSMNGLLEYQKTYEVKDSVIKQMYSMAENTLSSVLNYMDGENGNPHSTWTVTIKPDSKGKKHQISISAKKKYWSGLNLKCLDKDYKKDTEKFQQFQLNLAKLDQNWLPALSSTSGIFLDAAANPASVCRISDLQKSLQAAKDKSSRIADESIDTGGSSSDNQGTDEGTGATTVRLKTATFNTNNLLSDLPENLKVQRGTNDEDIKNMGISFDKVYEKAYNLYVEKHPKEKSIEEAKMGSGGFLWSKSTVKVPKAGSNAMFVSDVLDVMMMIDDLGTYKFDSGNENVDYEAFKELNYINEDGKSTINTTDTKFNWKYGSENNFSAGYSDLKNNKFADPVAVDPAAVVSLYSTYCFSSLYENTEVSKQETIGRIGFKMNTTGLPEIPKEPLAISGKVKSDMMLKSIRDWLYYLLHPTDGFNYVRELVTNKVNAFLIGWHNDMLGTYGVGNNVGTTRYRNTTGYVTTPDLSEIEWTDALIGLYNDLIPFLIVIMLVTMVFSYITGVLSLQHSIFGFVLFACFLLLPVNLINGVVGASNRISEKLYGEKFTYWALIQQESYGDAIYNAAEKDTYENYLQTLYRENSKVYSNQGSESIVLKWQAPKKMTSFMFSSDDSYSSLKPEGQQMLDAMFGSAKNGETYLGPESLYMFRSYLDISNYSQYIYRGLKEGKRDYQKSLDNSITGNYNDSLKSAVQDIGKNFLADREVGYANSNNGSNEVDSGMKIQVPLSSSIINDSLVQKGTIKDLKISDYVGINPDLFNFGIPVFNKGNTGDGGDGTSKRISDYIVEGVLDKPQGRQDRLKTDLKSYTDRDFSGLAAYSLYSENVFFYFSWDLYDQGLEPSAGTKGGYKDLILEADKAGYFYNTKGNGELKDFMDMRSLFTYVIPYLKQCNDIVREWDNVYGLFLYEGVPCEEGHWDDEAIKGTPENQDSVKEMQQKYWHNLNVARLYGLYTPWVDIMYDCSYAKPELIDVMGEKKSVDDPLDPALYPKERPMIFSESEMHDYGLTKKDLTKVESLIIDCNRGMQDRLYDLLNYYSFSDVTMNTAAAMNCAFEFNSVFSENGIFSDNHNIYPQSYELADFSYDAFLRFILSNSTGETMNTQDDFYNNIVNNSSMTTAIVMLVADIISVYLLPAFKLLFIILVFLSSILVIITTAFRVDTELRFIKRVLNCVVTPMIKFFLITIGFSFLISLFMGTGYNGVTQSKEISIKLGDPVSVMLAIIAIDLLVLVAYFFVIRDVFRYIKKYSRMVTGFVGGVIGGIGGIITGSALAKSISNMGSRRSSSGGNSGNVSQNGTGISSQRAENRGSNNIHDYEEDYSNKNSSTRQNDTKRDTIDTYKDNYEDNRKKTEELNNKVKQGGTRVNKPKNDYNDTSNERRNMGKFNSDKSVNELGDSKKEG